MRLHCCLGWFNKSHMHVFGEMRENKVYVVHQLNA